MKKILKKTLFTLFLLTFSALSLLFVSCGKEELIKKEYQDTEFTPEISFSVTEVSLSIGDEGYLSPNYKKAEGYVLSFYSLDESVVKVDRNGKISAEGEGEAKVVVTYSNDEKTAAAEIRVNCSFSGLLPELKTRGVDGKIAVPVGEEYKVLPFIAFNGKEFSDADITYTVNDPSVAEVSLDGTVSARARGTTELVIAASWRGKDKDNTPTMQKVISVSVLDDVRFFNGPAPVSDEVLCVIPEFNGVNYKNSIKNEFCVVVNGVENSADIEIENPEVLVENNGYLVANRFGSSLVTIKKTVDGETYSKMFNVEVVRADCKVEEVVPLFGTIDGKYLDTDGIKKGILSFVNDTGAIVDAYQGNRPLLVEGEKIKGVISSSDSKRGEAQITVGTDKVVYTFALETLSVAISNKDDLKSLELTEDKVLTGYYELTSDVDATGLTLTHSVKNDGKAYFAGVFNGNGHVIENLSLQQNSSMFGVLSSAATVKNLALRNLFATKAYFLAQDTVNDGLTISDVFISLSPLTVTPRGLTGRTGSNSVCKNVVIEYLGGNAENGRNYQERYAWQGLIGGVWRNKAGDLQLARDSLWSNVFVISPFTVSFRCDDENLGNGVYAAVYGYGANEKNDIYGNPLDVSLHQRENPNLGQNWWTKDYYDFAYTNLYHYNSYAEMDDSSHDLTGFSDEFWVKLNGRVVWKSLFSGGVTLRLFDGDTDLGDSNRISGLNKELSVKAFYGDKEIDGTELTVEDNDYALKIGKNGIKLVMPPMTPTEIGIKVTVSAGAFTVTKDLTVLATSAIINVDAVYDYVSEEDGKVLGKPFPMQEIVGGAEVISVYQGPTPLRYDKTSGTITGLTANIEGTGEERKVLPVELNVNTSGSVYVLSVKVYTKVINDAKDMSYFNQTLPENAYNTYDGYYILTANVNDYSSVYNNAPDNNHGLKSFTGTFDGNGHSVSLKVNKGVFGVLGNGAVIKNVAFTDMRVLVDNAYTSTAIVAGYISNSTDVVVVKNAFISMDVSEGNPYRQYLSQWFTTAMLVGSNASLKSKFESIIIESDIFHGNYNELSGQPCLFRYWDGINNAKVGGAYADNTAADSLTDIYAISKDRTNNGGLFRITATIGKQPSSSMALTYGDYVYAVNNGIDPRTERYLPETYESEDGEKVTVKRYDSYDEMGSDSNDYSAFDPDFWVLTGKTPVWKNK